MPLEPLFAANKALWLRVWIATQSAAVVVACSLMIAHAGGARAFLASPAAPRSVLTVAMLIAYHGVGLQAHDWMLRRPWAVAMFVPVGWALILSSVAIHPGFGVLLLGAILQGFIFLPFTWAITTLALLVLLTIAVVITQAAVREPGPGAALTLARVVALLASGITFGTVVLYIHRVNRDAREAGAREERQRLARDIHDTVAQGFASVIKHLEAVELSFDAPLAARSHLVNAQAVSRASLDEIRRLVWALRPPQLVEATLPAAIGRIVRQWGEAHAIAATCEVTECPPLHPDAEVIFLRATQEALSNVARHAGAARVTVAMHCVDGLVLLSIEDDGRGFAEPAPTGANGVGIAGMRERVRAFGGRVMIDTGPGMGTSLTVALPLAAIAAAPV